MQNISCFLLHCSFTLKDKITLSKYSYIPDLFWLPLATLLIEILAYFFLESSLLFFLLMSALPAYSEDTFAGVGL